MTENKIIIVRGNCFDCPFGNNDEGYCDYPKGDYIDLNGAAIPDNCPLQKQGIEIRLDF